MLPLLKFLRRRTAKPAAPPPPSRPPLPGKLFAELVGLEAMRNRRLDDRRRRPRLNRGGAVSLIVGDRDTRQTVAANVRDMSAEGISLDTPIALPCETTLSMKMPRMSDEGSIDLTYTVRRCQAQPHGRFLIGAELLHYRASSLPAI